MAERYGVRGFANIEEAIADPTIASPKHSRSAVVATPANHHLDIALRLAEAGIIY